MMSVRKLRLKEGFVHVRFYTDVGEGAVKAQLADRVLGSRMDDLANLSVVGVVVARKREAKKKVE